MHKTRRAECPCSSVPPAGTPALPALLQSPELGPGSVQELPCAQLWVMPAWGFCYWCHPPGRGGEAQGLSAQSSSLATTPEPLPWVLQLQGHPRGLPGAGGHSHCSCSLGLSWGCWIGQFRTPQPLGQSAMGAQHPPEGLFQRSFSIALTLSHCTCSLDCSAPPTEMQGLGPGGLWREENGKLSSGKSSAAVSVTWQRDSVSSSHVGWVTQGLGNLSGIPAMSHGGNNGNVREQERIFHLVTSLGHQEQRESPLPLHRTGNRARKAEVHNSVLSEYSCHKTGENKESPDCL